MLVPECCNLTGLSEEMLGDFNLMKALNGITKKEPVERLGLCSNLIEKFKTHPETKAAMT